MSTLFLSFAQTATKPSQNKKARTITASCICSDPTALTGWESHPDFSLLPSNEARFLFDLLFFHFLPQIQWVTQLMNE